MPNFELSQVQKDEYAEKGYTRIPGAIPSALLSRLRNMADRLLDSASHAHRNGREIPGSCFYSDADGERLIRYNDLHGVQAETVLDLLACPPMMAIFRELAGRYAVPLQVDLLYKHPHAQSVVAWHQDAIYPRAHPYFNVGVFLDDANEDDGCLCYIPGTQHERQDMERLSRRFGWEIPGVEACAVNAGDITVHDTMTVHGSKIKQLPGTRRTVYVEVRPYQDIIDSGTQSREWAELRRRFMGLVLRRAGSADWPEEWKADYPRDLGTDEQELASIIAHWEPPIPANYAKSPLAADGS